tara:strand:- start:403294 stop:403557 length:264 start_codon:yes stop_codon:yes gene_type:complete
MAAVHVIAVQRILCIACIQLPNSPPCFQGRFSGDHHSDISDITIGKNQGKPSKNTLFPSTTLIFDVTRDAIRPDGATPNAILPKDLL